MLRRLRNLLQSDKLAKDIGEELEFHRSKTSGSFGNVTQIAEQAREASLLVWLDTLFHDVRYGFRQLRKSRLLVTTAIASLALGIGANTAIFTLIKAVMLQSLPVTDPARLVLFYDGIDTGVYSGESPGSEMFSVPFARYLQEHNDVFASLCSFRQEIDRTSLIVGTTSGSAPTERVRAHLVSGRYFETFGVRAAAGRLLRWEDDRSSATPVAILSHRFWKARFGGRQTAIGQTVTLNSGVFTIAGVAQEGFFGERVEREPEFWVPLSFQPQITRRESWLDDQNIYFLNMLGRLKPGVSKAAAQAAIAVQLRQYYRARLGSSPSKDALKKVLSLQPKLRPGGSGISGLRYRFAQPLRILMGVVGLVLLIACANIATLLLARDAARRPEFLARLALGASRSRLVRQVLTESVLLALLGGLAGAALAWGCARFLLLAMHVDSVVKVKPDASVLAFTLAVTIATGLLFGSLPALLSSRIDLRHTTCSKHRPKAGSGQSLIALQVALSIMLLICSGLLVRSLLLLGSQELGFNKDNLLVVETDPRLAGYEPKDLFALYRELDARLNAFPGVLSATLARYTPISGSKSSSNFSIQGYTAKAGETLDVNTTEVAPRFFQTFGIPLVLGRWIDERDTPSSKIVAVVNNMFVNAYFKGQDPIGCHISLGAPFKSPGAEIVGVVGDSKYFDLRESAAPMAFFSVWQTSRGSSFVYANAVVLRTRQSPLRLASAARELLKSVDSRLPILRTRTMSEQIDSSLEQQRLLASLCSAFGILALLLAAVGIYGTLAYSVARRKPEIGIRMAIGAQRHHVLWMVLRESAQIVAMGLLAGLPLAYWAATALRSYLFGITLTDGPAALVAISSVVVFALLAAYLPARRATKVDPTQALRYE